MACTEEKIKIVGRYKNLLMAYKKKQCDNKGSDKNKRPLVSPVTKHCGLKYWFFKLKIVKILCNCSQQFFLSCNLNIVKMLLKKKEICLYCRSSACFQTNGGCNTAHSCAVRSAYNVTGSITTSLTKNWGYREDDSILNLQAKNKNVYDQNNSSVSY